MSNNYFDLVTSEVEQESRAIGVHGVACGIVTKNNDPKGLGRVKISFRWLDRLHETEWTRVSTLMAGSNRGCFFLPDLGDQVLVAFEHGDINSPFVIGALWNKEDKAPHINPEGSNNIKKIRSRSGHEIIFDDDTGKENLEIHTSHGHRILLDDSLGSAKIIIKDSTGSNSIEIDSLTGSISISALGNITLKAPIINMQASALISFTAPVIQNQASGTLLLQSQAIAAVASGAMALQAGGGMACVAGGPLILGGSPLLMF
jgi:uncharacterized protein involved in type VI secretion and phage assembly